MGANLWDPNQGANGNGAFRAAAAIVGTLVGAAVVKDMYDKHSKAQQAEEARKHREELNRQFAQTGGGELFNMAVGVWRIAFISGVIVWVVSWCSVYYAGWAFMLLLAALPALAVEGAKTQHLTKAATPPPHGPDCKCTRCDPHPRGCRCGCRS